jgi:hypothetical protein
MSNTAELQHLCVGVTRQALQLLSSDDPHAILFVYRYREQRDRPDLTLPETLQLYLETRFEQLKVRHAFCILYTDSVRQHLEAHCCA